MACELQKDPSASLHISQLDRNVILFLSLMKRRGIMDGEPLSESSQMQRNRVRTLWKHLAAEKARRAAAGRGEETKVWARGRSPCEKGSVESLWSQETSVSKCAAAWETKSRACMLPSCLRIHVLHRGSEGCWELPLLRYGF